MPGGRLQTCQQGGGEGAGGGVAFEKSVVVNWPHGQTFV